MYFWHVWATLDSNTIELLAEEADVLVKPVPPNHADHVGPPPLPVQDKLCPDKEYRESEEIVSQIQAATSEVICEATDSVLAPFSARQLEYEQKTDAQFSALEDQLQFLSGFL